MFRVSFSTVLLSLVAILLCTAQTPAFNDVSSLKAKNWVDSLYANMTLDERVGQLLMIRAHSDKGTAYEAEVSRQIMNYKVGGLCFFQGTPERQASLTNEYQRLSPQVPLMISMDAEWGLNMRLKEACIGFPRQLMLGAIEDNSLIYEMGLELGRQCKRLGVHINFAPVVDVNNNPYNPVINDRSFGEDRYNVAAKSYAYMLGMQEGGIMACAKHFPGHGDTDVDSHLDLPIIGYSRDRLDSIELMPFKVLAQHGIGSMMVAHLQVPSIDNVSNRPTTLSEAAIMGVLKGDLGYRGLIFTDAMEMKGVTKYFGPGEASATAIMAGNDIVLLPDNVEEAVAAIKRYIAEGKITATRLEDAVKRILLSKYQLGLNQTQYISPYSLREDINSQGAYDLKRKLIQNAITLVRDSMHVLPINTSSTNLSMATLVMGNSGNASEFQLMLSRNGAFRHYSAGKSPSAAQCNSLLEQLKEYGIVVISLQGLGKSPKNNFGLSDDEINLIYRLQSSTKVVLVNFGSPYALKFFDGIETVVEAYNEEKITQELTAEALFGVFPMKGRLPVSAGARSLRDMGLVTEPVDRLRYDTPESVGMSTSLLERMDYVAQEAIDKGATPGCQVLVARKGVVVYHKAYGYTTYDKKTPITTEHVFDLASITKVMATTTSLMYLHDQNIINVNKHLGAFLSSSRGTNKEHLLISDILIHEAGLQAWIPFYKETMMRDATELCVSPDVCFPVPQGAFSVPTAPNMYFRADYPDMIRKKILDSPLNDSKAYKYSDLSMYLMADLIKEQTGQTLDSFAYKQFFQPLGLGSTGFNPWSWLPDSLKVPTEEDNYFRMQRVNGYVHDMGAAMMGGVSGHAGLFSKCSDMAVWAQMLLNGGVYAGRRYFEDTTVKQFTTRQGGSTRRGWGFDMKETGKGKSANMSSRASAKTFGHTGFTGNCIWVDPEKDLIFIFLSNRTYPTMENNKLINGDYRPRIQTIVYEAIVD